MKNLRRLKPIQHARMSGNMLPWAGEWCIHFASFLCYQICLQKRFPCKCTRHQADQIRFLEEAALAVFFPYTAYTISYNGGYSSFLDLFHGIKSCHKGLRKSRPRARRVQGHTPWTQPCAFDKSLRQSYNDHSTGRQKACRGRQKPRWEVPEEPKAGPCRICFFGTLCRQGTCRKGHRERKEDAAPCFCAIPVG